MRRTADARIVIADQVLAAPRQLGIFLIQYGGKIGTQVLLDPALVLRRGRDDPRRSYQTIRPDTITMIDQPARRLGGVTAFALARLIGNQARARLALVILDDGRGFLAGVDQLHGAGEDA